MRHGPLNVDFTVYGLDAERMELGQSWPVKVNGSTFMAEVISIRKADGLGRAATLRVVVTLETGEDR